MRRLFLACLFATVLCASPARAEESIINQPGEHPRYGIDVEPHVLVGYGGFGIKDGTPGVGVRGTFILVENGFVPSINNNVGLGLGFDAFLSGGAIDIPVVMQWNFFLSTHWSVFGEPGIGLELGGRGVLHAVAAVGGRYHFTEHIALTMRLGYPTASIGVAFLL
jgi:hypothetical protein